MNNSLADYSLIGNCRSAALVSKQGSIDWCCIPEFHSPSIFARLLDTSIGGFFAIRPSHAYQSNQTYLDYTNVVETSFDNDEGRVLLRDAFVAREQDEKVRSLFPDHEILRIVEGVVGSVKMKMEYSPRKNYGKDSPGLKDYKACGIHFVTRENVLIFQSTLTAIHPDENNEKVEAEFLIQQGEKIIFSLSCSCQHPAIIPEIKRTAHDRMQGTIQYWKSWIGKCAYQGIFKDSVLRSALTLKLLTHAASGAIIAAPTTSLPEALGGVRNWDYRYCWLRDASFTVRALLRLGYHDEAKVYMSWILHATQLTRPKLQVVYSVFGHSKLAEKNCDWLSGYKNSKPVRIGNAAHEQFQLDVYGEVLDAIFKFSDLVENFDRDSKRFIIGLGNVICSMWDKPDDGIWEIRSSPVHHTHSKVMAWVGLDRLIRICRKYNWRNAPVAKFEKVLKLIEGQIESQGFNHSLGHYTRLLNGADLDASLLVLPLVDYCAASSPRMTSTRENIQSGLSDRSFVYRNKNEDGLQGKEGAFLVCNFWLVENLAKAGLPDEAASLFQKTIERASLTGLLSEEIDPVTGELLGNYPQGFSHIGLINAALSINDAYENSSHGH